MYFKGYELQVLINNILLKEYLGPRKNVPYRYTSPNWVDNHRTGVRMESEFLHYISMPSSQTQFTVQVSSSEATYLAPIIAEIRINGVPTHKMTTTSFSRSSLNPKGLLLNSFEKRQQICTLESQEKQLIGAVSVFFYKAETLLQKKSEIPLAILHLHYRSKDTLMKLIQNKTLSIEYVEGQDDLNYKENGEFKEENNSSYHTIKPNGENNIYYSEEPLIQFQGNEQYNNGNRIFQKNVLEQSEIIEILDD